MKIAVLGTGYVGLSTGVCLSDSGHEVVCMDVDEEKIEQLSKGIPPIYEPGLKELLKRNIGNGRLKFTTSHKEGLHNKEVIIIAVGTPQSNNGSADLSFLEQAAKDIAENLNQNAIITIKSTVPVGTNDVIKNILKENLPHDISVDMAANPEFLRQGSAISDTLKADRIVIGTENKQAASKLEKMYSILHIPILHTSIRSAEMIKYASNAFLAMKISFINEIANLCEATGANVEDVSIGMGLDKRIGEAFLKPGIGYGGSCFPKDVKALYHTASEHDMNFGLLEETMTINNQQRELLVWKALSRFGDLNGKKIAMLGLSFKPETDDLREAPSIVISNELINQGARVSAYDPVAMNNAKKVLNTQVEYAKSPEEAVLDADAVFIVTEWKSFVESNWKQLVKEMKSPIIFDGRNCLKEEEIIKCEQVEYYPIGKPKIIKA
ncbi:UDP-glucose dehydrogenase family protein [Oceanobacillus halophilus]|uniref:UDP-glucose 6-dehydrogenase n=1 Tax=Oceanobacillus halophilus TaxID=930130 RepID=A0A494ZTZ6_9BACI|nr:UDP-glucose/GDP-mannose dehydrogenase family protein [Oceanobacillus halophilus]RKQ29700.1 UDP-glucose/GDP-mannose dehydrogenase family protein [Oceanobacillus halophilus]